MPRLNEEFTEFADIWAVAALTRNFRDKQIKWNPYYKESMQTRSINVRIGFMYIRGKVERICFHVLQEYVGSCVASLSGSRVKTFKNESFRPERSADAIEMKHFLIDFTLIDGA